MREIWVDIIDYEGHYKISNTGRVKSIKRSTELILKPQNHSQGYLYISLSKPSCKITKFLIHRLVATHFITNNNNLLEVNHIDGIKTNNHVNNLEWCTSRYNKIHAIKLGLRKRKSGGCKSIHQFDMNNNYIRTWSSIINASNQLGIDSGDIVKVLKGRRKSAGKFIWRYSDG